MTEFPSLLFDEEALYQSIREYAAYHDLKETLSSLPFAANKHKGQLRDNKGNIPYFIHPLQITRHAISLGLNDDMLLAACLLHDVCEDCGVSYEELPVSNQTRQVVQLLTKEWEPHIHSEEKEEQYYRNIAANPVAAMVKLLDRCNNISSMSLGLSRGRIARYLEETRKYYQPLVEQMLRDYPQYEMQIYTVFYQMHSVYQALERMLQESGR